MKLLFGGKRGGRGRGERALLSVVLACLGALAGLFLALASPVGAPFPGFFFTPDYRLIPVDEDARRSGLRHGDRLLSVDGASPLAVLERVQAAAAGAPVLYRVRRGAETFTVVLPARPFTWEHLVGAFAVYFAVSLVMLAVGVLVYLQNPRARPNRNFLLYMCLWALSNVSVPEVMAGLNKWSAPVNAMLGLVLSVHGWVVFLTYPVNPDREAWLRRHRVAPLMYGGALVLGIAVTAVSGVVFVTSPESFVDGWLYPATRNLGFVFAVASFPVKTLALLDTRRRAASPLVNQQTAVLLWGIGLGLGLWLLLMLAPLLGYYSPPVDPQIGSALVLIYPLAIAYATVRYRLFDVTVVINRSLVYTLLAGLITGAYALLIALSNAILQRAEIARSPWFGAAFVFAVALAFNPVRTRVQALVDRTFFRTRYDYARTIRGLAADLTSLLDMDEIVRRVTGAIEPTMQARHLTLHLRDRETGALAPYAGARESAGGAPRGLPRLLASADGPGALSRYQLAADPRYAEVAPAALALYRQLDAEVLVPLRFQQELRGVLVLGPKRSESPYTAEDLDLLETLAAQTAVAVENATTHAQVVRYADELAASLRRIQILESIRSNLAKFVPKTVQDLIEQSPEAPLLDKREADVSVLFADITGYTRLSSRLDLDEVNRLVERYFGSFLDEIVRHGGDVNETAGDGLMVIFQDPDPRRHARAAVLAALGIQRRTREINAEPVGSSEPIAMRVGVNSGIASVGATKIEGAAGTRWTYTASGPTTNVAARLAALAEGGDVVVSEGTRRRLDAAFAVEDLGSPPLKNVEQPVRAFRLRGDGADAAPLPARGAAAPPARP